ncbi:MAG TPA: DUF6152 family protein [Bryobacteraceae bacterium]|nr:DUF6152 family protein [Bryobacteraceae bacterium]
MRKTKKTGFFPAGAVTLGLIMTCAPAFSHHAFSAEYDVKKPITLTGAVTKIEWTNPHARFYVSVTDESGQTTVWNFELASPNGLMRRGWNRNSIKPGDTVTVMGYLAKDGSKMANTRSVTMPDGRKIFAGTPDDGGPTQ